MSFVTLRSSFQLDHLAVIFQTIVTPFKEKYTSWQFYRIDNITWVKLRDVKFTLKKEHDLLVVKHNIRKPEFAGRNSEHFQVAVVLGLPFYSFISPFLKSKKRYFPFRKTLNSWLFLLFTYMKTLPCSMSHQIKSGIVTSGWQSGPLWVTDGVMVVMIMVQ